LRQTEPLLFPWSLCLLVQTGNLSSSSPTMKCVACPLSLLAPSSGIVGNCLSFTTGTGIGSAGFVCVGGTTATTLPSSYTATSTMSTNTATMDTSTPSTTLPPNPASTTQPYRGQDTTSFGDLSQIDKIALGCAIALGVPALLFAYMTWNKRQDIFPHGHGHCDPLDDSPPPYKLHHPFQPRR
jgi:hypothetical protein